MEHLPQPRAILRWSAYEHEHIERGGDWFWALGIATIAIALVSILFHNILFSIVIIVGAITLGMLATIRPELVQFEISERGIRIQGKLHRYDEIISFWVEEEHADHPLLLVDTTKFMAPNLIIPIEHIDPRLVRAYLKEHVPEVHMKEPLSHKILEFFGL